MQPHKAGEGRIQHGAVHHIGKGIGPVQNDQRLLLFSACLHDVGQRADVRVKAHAHILQIKEHDIDIGQIFRRGFFVRAVKRDHGNLYAIYVFIFDVLARRITARESVLRGENLHHVEVELPSAFNRVVQALSLAVVVQTRRMSDQGVAQGIRGFLENFHLQSPRMFRSFQVRGVALCLNVQSGEKEEDDAYGSGEPSIFTLHGTKLAKFLDMVGVAVGKKKP